MEFTRRRALAALVIAIVLLMTVVAGCSTAGTTATTSSTATGTAATGTPIKIGAVVSLTGSYAAIGAAEKTALDMEVKRINDAGGINGHPIDLIIKDDATDAAKAQAAVTQLIDQDKVVAVIGASGTGQTVAMRGAVDRAGVPDVSMAGGTAVVKPFDPLVFATPWSNAIVVPYELDYMKKQGIKTIALIGDSGGFGKDGMATFAAEAPKAGIKIISSQTFNLGDTDMTAQLSKIKATNPDAVVIVTAGAEAATVAKNYAQLKMTAPLYGTHGNARMQFIQGAGPAAENFKFAAGKILIPSAYGTGTPAYTTAETFIKDFTAASGGTPPSTFAGHAYDAINLIANAAKTLPVVTGAALRDAIEKTSGWVGIDGTFTFSPTDHNGMTANDLTMYVVKDGKWQLAQ
jgi:branched-chain amino acid transport system substrate-binding protein